MAAPKTTAAIDYGGKPGHAIFYFTLRYLGPLPAYTLLIVILPYYLLVRRQPRKLASYYLRHRFPGDNRWRRFFRTIYYYYQFGLVLIDQAAIGILGRERFKIEFHGREELYKSANNTRGTVLLTSHIGNWQTAMLTMEDLENRVNVLMRLENHTQERLSFNLQGGSRGMHIIDINGFMGGLVEASRALHNGEIVAIMGDRCEQARVSEVDFLGEKAGFPLTAFHLAEKTGSDLIMFLVVRTGKLAFKIEYCLLNDLHNQERGQAERYLTDYVRNLEKYLQSYPYMWFNYFNFWG